MSIFVCVHMKNHGLDQRHVGSAYGWVNGKFLPLKGQEALDRHYMDWTIISKIIDSDNFECFTGERETVALATNLPKEKEDPRCGACGQFLPKMETS